MATKCLMFAGILLKAGYITDIFAQSGGHDHVGDCGAVVCGGDSDGGSPTLSMNK